MRNRRFLLSLVIVPLLTLAFGCATTETQPTLSFEEHTLRIPLTVQANGSVSLAQSPPLIGRIDLSPILRAEGISAAAKTRPAVQMMVNYGRFYLVGEGFRSIWEITPQPGSSSASYRPIAVVADGAAKPVREPRLSRYGSSQSSCLRLDRTNGPPLFITPKGEAANACP
jgi:hypothetical protein